jgi:hypothetical protein
VAGAAGTGGAAGAGTLAAAGGGRELVPYLGGTGAHHFFHLGLAAVGAFDLGVAAEDQLFEVLVAALTMKLENRHFPSPWYGKRGRVSESPPLQDTFRLLIIITNSCLEIQSPGLMSKNVGPILQIGGAAA